MSMCKRIGETHLIRCVELADARRLDMLPEIIREGRKGALSSREIRGMLDLFEFPAQAVDEAMLQGGVAC